jgi:SAM-dependent methyltransferase
VRRRVKETLMTAPLPGRERLLRAGYRGYERYLSLKSSNGAPTGPPADLPLPPARLRVMVVSTAERDFFLESGREHAEWLRALLAEHGVEWEHLRSVLDLGCGCGRMERWWSQYEGPRLYGCDYNPDLAGWCADHLPFLDARVNDLAPPLPFDDVKPFGLIYAHSVFTHLTAELERSWLAEIRASLGPGDLFVFTISGERYRWLLPAADQARFDRGEPVVHFDEVAGTNLCAAYHPPAYVRERMLDGFELLAAVYEGTPQSLGQDVYVARRTASPV